MKNNKKISVVYSTQYTPGVSSIAKCEEVEWQEIVNTVMNNDWEIVKTQEDKSKLMLWNLGSLHVDLGQRKNDNIKSRTGLMLDYDGDVEGVDFEYIINDLKDFEFVLYSSVSYGVKSGYRCRVILPFENEISGERFKEFKETFIKRFHYLDASCFVLSQGQNIPAHWDGIEPYKFYNEGEFFNPENLEFVENFTEVAQNFHYEKIEISNEVLKEFFDVLVENNRGQFSRNQSYQVAQCLLQHGITDPSIVQQLQHFDAQTPASDFFKPGKGNYPLSSLKKYMPADFVMPTEFEKKNYNHGSFHAKEYSEVQNESTEFTQEFWLEENQYLSDIASEMNFTSGITLLIADCGVGKTHFWSNFNESKIALIAPLNVIVRQNTTTDKVNNIIESNIATYQQLDKIPHGTESEYTLVIDESHGLYLDQFKLDTNRKIIERINKFKSVVLMSGTIHESYFSSFEVDQTIRVHKKTDTKKIIQQHRVELDSKLSLVEVCLNQVKSRKDKKMVIFHNNINECETIMIELEKVGLKLLPVSAEPKHKSSEDFKRFVETQSLGDYDGLCGTNSLVEGINITDILAECDIHIIGNNIPMERIEQVANRFRKVSERVNVFHYLNNEIDLLSQIEFINSEEYRSVVEDECRVVNRRVNMMPDYMKRKVLNTFNREMRHDHLYYNYGSGQIEVDSLSIDCFLSTMRTELAQVNYNYYRSVLASYGFLFLDPVNRMAQEDFKLTKAELKALKFEEHQTVVSMLKECFVNSKFEFSVNELTHALNEQLMVQAEHVESFIGNGLSVDDVPEYLDRLSENENYWQRLSADIRDSRYGNVVSDYISSVIDNLTFERKGVTYIDPTNKTLLAQGIVEKVLEKYFSNDAFKMANHPSWSSKVKDLNGSIILNDHNGCTKDIIERFIGVGSSKKLSVNNLNTRCVEITSKYNRTGFKIITK
ncbi:MULTISPECIES: hypothetical protein [unclassified Tatumella]|uniref:hypothetical protein n=1 Tax=unclassified Tatumella TaxID=2649542 RepID=UPI001BAE9BE6|nr:MULTISPECIES: hypothetical protein [unclassified Tatumella]MBS0876519.1 hypothetical protein [Tatumella sp. JGM82]MBS0889692.1 hypothetical protein [Tatumella sp. JGM94]MBS0900814.1 hypothetical protein [Tatumella sp. JGM100]